MPFAEKQTDVDANMKLCRIQENGADDLISKEEIETLM